MPRDERRERTRPRKTGDFRQELGKQVLKLRTERGWSRPKLAEASVINKQQLDRIERGEVDAELGLIEQLESAFGLERGQLLWPVWSPDHAFELEVQAERSFRDEAYKAIEVRRQAYLAGLDDPRAVWVMDSVARLARDAPEVLELLGKMLVAAANDKDPLVPRPGPLGQVLEYPPDDA